MSAIDTQISVRLFVNDADTRKPKYRAGGGGSGRPVPLLLYLPYVHMTLPETEAGSPRCESGDYPPGP